MANVLELVDVPMSSEGGLNLTLQEGDAVLLETAANKTTRLVAPVLLGLHEPPAGQVLFCGQSWTDMSVSEACRARGKTRRVFAGEGWVSNLSIVENIMLSERHHTRQEESDILKEMQSLGATLGMMSL